MKKVWTKVICIGVFVCLSLVMTSMCVKKENGLKYALESGGNAYSVVEIGIYREVGLIIPVMHNGLPVISIGKEAFKYCWRLNSLVISENIIEIKTGAFDHCYYLKSAEIGSGVTKIGDYAFNACNSLERITFKGTVEQWNDIEKGVDWNYGIPATEVVCSDGSVEI